MNTLGTWYQTHHQELLESHLRSLFPRHHIHKNTRSEAGNKNAATQHYLEVDAWVPSLMLSFEFQDFYHYKTAWYSQLPLGVVQQKDNMKRLNVLARNQTLIVVPCWWGGDVTSLQATIYFHRPDLNEIVDISSRRDGELMPSNPPPNFYEGGYPLMHASFPESNIMDEGEWWMGEKWDGVRCFWDAAEKQLYSRNSVPIDVRSTGLDLIAFGNLFLDAELWCGRGCFNESQAIVANRGQHVNDCQANNRQVHAFRPFVRLLCFDEASMITRLLPFETRYTLILSHMHDDHAKVINAARMMCGRETMVTGLLHRITDGGGEGVVLRRACSRYLPGRSDDLFKIKAAYSDHEALVVDFDAGSLLLQLPNGSKFSVDKRNCMLHQQAMLDDIVTFRVHSPIHAWASVAQAPEKLASPVVYRIRTDITWNDVLRNSSDVTCNHVLLNSSSDEPYVFLDSANVRHSWQSPAARRAFFDAFAASQAMDPLNPTFWYRQQPNDLLKFHSGYKIISENYGGSLPKVLAQIYPDIGLQLHRFPATQPWKHSAARLAFFNSFASAQGMDPLNPVFWRHVSERSLALYDRRSKSIYNHYFGKLSTTLLRLYPDIGIFSSAWEPQKLEEERRSYEVVRKKTFDEFAASNGHDPLNPVFWYTVTPEEFRRYNNNTSISSYHNLYAALTQSYPGIALKLASFKVTARSDTVATSKGRESSNRIYFDNFAATKRMDPLNPLFWYHVTTSELRKFKAEKFKKIMVQCGGKLYAILNKVYLNIGLQKNKMKGQVSWKRERDRRAFFDDFAASRGMDPLNPIFWYNVSQQDLKRDNKGYKSISNNYGGKLSTILLQLYPNIGLRPGNFKRTRSMSNV